MRSSKLPHFCSVSNPSLLLRLRPDLSAKVAGKRQGNAPPWSSMCAKWQPGAGGWGAGGRLQGGQRGNRDRGPAVGCGGDENAREGIRNPPQPCTRHPPAASDTPPPRPPASYGVRRGRHYARGITVSQPPRQPHGLAVLTASTATPLTGPWPLTSSVPPVTRHDAGPRARRFQLAVPRERGIQKQRNPVSGQRSRRHYEEESGFALIYAAAASLCACVISTFCAAQRSWAETAEGRRGGN
ncbi:uncharacterized protein [Vulpes vulpes]|uniref:Uncharacterized protein isoform X2 n=1 Tax=Vulpes vulpes TaxID=9627 RepID=A0ABM5B8K1_VULVU